MAVDLFRQRQLGGHQERRPIDRVEANDVLADQMDVGGPVFGIVAGRVGIADRGHVGGQRVDPDVHHMIGRAGNLDPPVEAGARDAEVAQAALDEADNLVAATVGADEVGIVAVQREQGVLIL